MNTSQNLPLTNPLSEGAADGKAEQGQSGGRHAHRRDHPGTEPANQPVALQAGHDGSHRDDGGKDARIGNRHFELLVDGGPGGAQQGIRQAQTDKGKIDHRQK